MRVLYFWIKKYKNLENVGLSFTGEYVFNEVYDGKNQLKQIEIKKNQDYINNFFDNDNISDVTLIVGRNGSGKTSVIELLRTILAEGDGIIHQEMIIILDDNSIAHPIFKVHKASGINADIIYEQTSLEATIYNVDSQPYTQPRISFNNYSTIIHYSNTLTQYAQSDVLGVIDITTAGLLESDYKNRESILSDSKSQVRSYFDAELERNISFLYGYKRSLGRKEFEDYLPYEIYLSYHRPPLEDLLINISNRTLEKNIKDIYRILSDKQNTKEELFINGLLLSIIFVWIKQSNLHQVEKFINLFHDKIDLTSNSITKKLISVGKALRKVDKLIFIDAAIKLIATLESAISKKDLQLFQGGIGLVAGNRGAKNQRLLKKIITLHAKVAIGISVLQFNWVNRIKGEPLFRRLSAGEQARLSFFSRLYDTIGSKNKYEDLHGDVLLLIDEGDTYYHPEWQRFYFTDILKAVLWFLKHKKVQLVITTNAPFIISDLPHWSVTQLVEDEKRLIQARRLSENENKTFAQNIHSLLANEFFMKFTIGEFAKNKIDKVIKELASKDKNKINNISEIIDLIGEPILRSKLMEMYRDKFENEPAVE